MNYGFVNRLPKLVASLKKKQMENKAHSPTKAKEAVLAELPEEERRIFEDVEAKLKARRKDYSKVAKSLKDEADQITEEICEICVQETAGEKRQAVKTIHIDCEGYSHFCFSREACGDIIDQQTFNQWMIENEMFYLLQIDPDALNTLVRDAVNKGAALPPGVKLVWKNRIS